MLLYTWKNSDLEQFVQHLTQSILILPWKKVVTLYTRTRILGKVSPPTLAHSKMI